MRRCFPSLKGFELAGPKSRSKAKEAKDTTAAAPVGSGIRLVIVESPTKAKTIRKFLGKGYVVESCMGHIRDLPQSAKDIPEKIKKEKWANLGVNVDNHFEPVYCVPKDKLKVVKNLKDKLDEASELFLATDEDREGESISWHIREVLKPKVPTKRMVFNEITKDAIERSLKDTREIDLNLVKAQETRRILDRLVGYTLSPLLWKKVAYGLSAGRVQSVAVRLISQREHERIRFKRAQYSGVSAYLTKEEVEFESRLLSVGGKRIATGKDFDGTTGQLTAEGSVLILDHAKAQSLATTALKTPWQVTEVEEKPVFRKPAAPFITSTLQQEANRKMGLSSRETMQTAQKLYEQGFITYMRTDSTFLSKEAIQAARECISSKYGASYLPPQPRLYDQKKVKGAQEAHEAIRPAGTLFQDPDETGLMGLQLKLYELIWKRTVASQMVDAKQKQVTAKFSVADMMYSASGMTIEFPGFLRVYVEGSDDPEAELSEREVRLPQLAKGQAINCTKTEPTDHETKPPARYTEASLVQKMEKEGIGRPSTYASIIGTIVDRGYIRRQANALVPTFTALVVSKLLEGYLPQYVDLQFTSEMEKELDVIADGEMDSEAYLTKLYFGKSGIKTLVDSQEKKIEPESARTITLEGLKGYTFHVGKFGAYVSTQRDGQEVRASIPESGSPADLTSADVDKWIEQKLHGADSLGKDPVTGLPIYVLTGRFGPYVQLGDVKSDDDKPKRMSIPPGTVPENLTLPEALFLVSLPKALGNHPVSEKEIKLGIGRFGPYVVHNGDFRSIPKTENIYTVDFAKAMELLNTPKKGRGRAAPLKEFGPHPITEEPILLMNGPYGAYLKCGKVNSSLPEGMDPQTVDLKIAVEVLSAKMGDAEKPTKKPAAKAKAKSKAKSKNEAQVEAAPAAKLETAKVIAKKTAEKSKKSPPKKATAAAAVVPVLKAKKTTKVTRAQAR